jgi:hypothetical protein
MKQCLDCSGLVPPSLDACPNCAVDRRAGRKLVVVAGLIALAATGCDRCGTPMAVYGGPPSPPPVSAKKVDAGEPAVELLLPPEGPDAGSP